MSSRTRTYCKDQTYRAVITYYYPKWEQTMLDGTKVVHPESIRVEYIGPYSTKAPCKAAITRAMNRKYWGRAYDVRGHIEEVTGWVRVV